MEIVFPRRDIVRNGNVKRREKRYGVRRQQPISRHEAIFMVDVVGAILLRGMNVIP